MATVFCYRGQSLDEARIQFVRQLITQNPGSSRRRLSAQLCRAWNWVQANGALRDMVCRGLMLGLHRAGLIELPPQRSSPANPLAQRRQPARLLEPSWDPIQCTVAELGQVARRICADWQGLYHHPIWLLETFIDPERFRGTCYRAANWIYLGLTTGRGKDDHTNRVNRSLRPPSMKGSPCAATAVRRCLPRPCPRSAQHNWAREKQVPRCAQRSCANSEVKVLLVR